MNSAPPNPLSGRGRELLLPAAGNPFGEPQATLPPVPAGFGEPRDLSPEDIAALFPSNDLARNQLPAPVASAGGSPLASPAAAPQDISADVLRGEPALFAAVNPFTPDSSASASAIAAATADVANPFSVAAVQPAGAAHSQSGLAGAATAPEDLEQLWVAIRNLEQQVTQPGRAGKPQPAVLQKPTAARRQLPPVPSSASRAAESEADVELRRAQGRRLVRWVLTRGLPILSYAVLWLGALAWLWQAAQRAVPADIRLLQLPLLDLLRSALLGSFGGTLATIYGVWVHTARRRDFDRHPLFRYLTKPGVGGIFGCLAPLLYLAVLQAFPEVPGWNSPIVLAINGAALLFGLLQDRIFQLIGRIFGVFGA